MFLKRICVTSTVLLVVAAARAGMVVQTWWPGKNVSYPGTLKMADAIPIRLHAVTSRPLSSSSPALDQAGIAVLAQLGHRR